jgi:choline dehydrogenase-like flavoprotein
LRACSDSDRRRRLTAGFDYDVVIIGSGFGGSVAALRSAEMGYRVGVMESGRRWKDEDIPKTQWDLPRFVWLPAAELYGIQRIEPLDDDGGIHVRALSAGRSALRMSSLRVPSECLTTRRPRV